jgi:hypothetical protein
MSRILVPTATHGSAPSHSPPDVRFAPTIGLARGLGWFSIGLGLAEIFLPETVGRLSGVRSTALLRVYGLREIACGVGILNSSQPAAWLTARVAGDALDLATVGAAAASGNCEQRNRACLAAAALAGVTALDVMCAEALGTAASLEG